MIFGIIANMAPGLTTGVFVGFLIFLVLLDYIFEYIEEAAIHKGLGDLFEKLKKELMSMGIVSFAVFIYTLAAEPDKDDATFIAFEMSHMIFFFMAISFIAQALFLTSFATTVGNSFIMALRTSTMELMKNYKDCKSDDRACWWFHNGSPFLPAYPVFRSTIEFKIIERLFIFQHKLSPEFNFAHYVNGLFTVYISELGHVSPASWILLAVLVVLNYFRAMVIDPTASGSYLTGCDAKIQYSDYHSANIVDAHGNHADHRRRRMLLKGNTGLDKMGESLRVLGGGGGGGAVAPTPSSSYSIDTSHAAPSSETSHAPSYDTSHASPSYDTSHATNTSHVSSQHDDHVSSSHHDDAHASHSVHDYHGTYASCQTYILIYTYFLSALLFLYTCIIYIVTTIYMQRIIRLSLEEDKIACNDVTDGKRGCYKESLKLMMRREKMLAMTEKMGALPPISPEEETKSDVVVYCRAKGCQSCTKPGSKHLCDYCNDKDSDHRSRACPNRPENGGGKKQDVAAVESSIVRPFGEDNDDMAAITDKPAGGGPKKSPRPGSVLPVNEPISAGNYLMSSQKSDTSEIGLLNKNERRPSMQRLLIAKSGGSSPSASAHLSPCISTDSTDAPVVQGRKASLLGGLSSMGKSIRNLSQKMNVWDVELGGMDARNNAHSLADGEDNHGEVMREIFAFKSPSLYFKSVEAILLLQCFYIAMVFTQMIPATVNGGWIIAFLLPIPIILYILQMILAKAVLLRAVFELNRDVAAQVVADHNEEKNAIKNLRAAVFKKMKDDNIPEAQWNDFLVKFFFKYDKKGEGQCSERDFERILGDLGIYMIHHSFKILWTAVDRDLSGGLDPGEILELFSPEEEVKEDEDLPAVKTLRLCLQKLLMEKGLPIKDWEDFVKSEYDKYDADGSGSIDKEEFYGMLEGLGIFLDSEEEKEALLHAVDKDKNGGITFDEMWNIVFPSNNLNLKDLL